MRNCCHSDGTIDGRARTLSTTRTSVPARSRVSTSRPSRSPSSSQRSSQVTRTRSPLVFDTVLVAAPGRFNALSRLKADRIDVVGAEELPADAPFVVDQKDA